jgi:hypothetical protein
MQVVKNCFLCTFKCSLTRRVVSVMANKQYIDNRCTQSMIRALYSVG